MEPDILSEAVKFLSSVRLRDRKVETIPDKFIPKNKSEAYRLQELLGNCLSKTRFGFRRGYKIGCTSKVMQKYLNVSEPCRGGIFANTVYSGDVACSYLDYNRPGVECEIAVSLGLDLDESGAPYNKDSVVEAIDTCMVAIEIVDDRYIDYRNLALPILVADDFFNAGCVLGDPIKNWKDLDIPNICGELSVNDNLVGRGQGKDVMGHPFNVVAWLANHLIELGQSLKAGEVILTGSLVETYWCKMGDQVKADIEGLGSATITFCEK